MSDHRIVLGRTFQSREAAEVQAWLNAWAAKGWEFVSVIPVVEPNHGLYVFRNPGTAQLDIEDLCIVFELTPDRSGE